MFKWKSYTFPTINNGEEALYDLLSGESGKNRVVKFVVGDIDSNIYLRAYRNSDQFVNIECDLPTTAQPFVPVDIPLAEGQTLSTGFYNLSAGAVTPTIAIGYEES